MTDPRIEGAARLLAEIAVTKNPRLHGFDSAINYTTDAVDRIVEHTWRSFTAEASALAGFFDAEARSAAPEMLAALKEVTVQLAQCACSRNLTTDEQIAIEAARAAIAKAEGR